MTKRRRIRVWMLPRAQGNTGLLLLGGCFLVGSLLGTLLVLRFWSGGEENVSQYLDQWALGLETAEQGQLQWLADLLHHLRFPAAVLLCGFVPLGVGAIPLLFLLRGVLISFTVSAFWKLYAWQGMASALLLYGPAELAGLLLQFVVGVSALRMAQERAFSAAPSRKRTRTVSLRPGVVWCAGMVGISLLQSALDPWAMRLISRLLTA